MKNGIEIRKNGNMIVKHPDGWWYARIKQPDGTFRPSTNGPWTYIYNARKDADGRIDQ